MTEITHHTRNIRVAPRKLRMVIDKVRHLPADKAIALMPLMVKRGAPHVEKAIKAAVEAAKDKDLNPETLVVQRIWADEGTAMKRIISRGRGRATGIMKKYSHLTVVLKGETGSSTKVAAKKRIKATEADVATETADTVENEKN